MYYTTTTPLGGRIKQRIADFIVEEEFEKGRIARVEAFGAEAVKQLLNKKWVENTHDLEQLHGVLEKYQYDQQIAMKTISRYLRVSLSRIGFAGLKDKRGITAQRISIYRPDIERLKSFDSRFIDFRPLEWSNQKIELGDLVGNHFVITIRDLNGSSEEIEQTILDFSKQCENGLPNFFGEQRFGGKDGITHVVGKCLVQQQMEQAVLTYLQKPMGGELEVDTQKRMELIKNQDWKNVLNTIDFKFRFERTIVSHLMTHPRDFVGAMQKLPKNMRHLFVHAYQSDLFNRLLENRIKSKTSLEPTPQDVLDDHGHALYPLIGFDLDIPSKWLRDQVDELLDQEGIKQSDFEVNAFREVSASGAWRPIKLPVFNFKLIKIEPDAFNEGKLSAVVSFSLTKGNYATTVMDELMKN